MSDNINAVLVFFLSIFDLRLFMFMNMEHTDLENSAVPRNKEIFSTYSAHSQHGYFKSLLRTLCNSVPY